MRRESKMRAWRKNSHIVPTQRTPIEKDWSISFYNLQHKDCGVGARHPVHNPWTSIRPELKNRALERK
jgi:hypothetical protein